MIGGYLYNVVDINLEHRLQDVLGKNFDTTKVYDNGFLFHDNCFRDDQNTQIMTKGLIILSQDLLVIKGSDTEYRLFDSEKDLDIYREKDRELFLNSIVSDYRMVLIEQNGLSRAIWLTSNRAGPGRIYYNLLAHGILFSTDLRFLFNVVPLDVNGMGIYSIIKYGAIPEPMTISKNVSAVPAAHYLKYNLATNKHSVYPYFKFEFKCKDNENAFEINPNIFDPAKDALYRSSKFLSHYDPSIMLSGGIDSSLYACYLNEVGTDNLKGFFCAFEDEDPELKYADEMAKKISADFLIGRMRRNEALNILDDVVRLTDHPFADFSSLPITFILKFIKETTNGRGLIVECNGGDDCFGFPALGLKSKVLTKHRFPVFFKRVIVELFKTSAYWKLMSHEGFIARLAALADVHEIDPLNYFLVHSPINYTANQVPKDWDEKLTGLMEDVFSNCGVKYESMGYKAKTTIRQLMHINSRQWTAKALSVGESLGLRIIYPYIWRDILVEQGKLPWNAKIHNGIVKWPLKKLLEEYMPQEFIYRKKSGFVPPFVRWLTEKDFNGKVREVLLAKKGYVTDIVPSRILDELLSDALDGNNLRFPVLNFLWAAIFTEMWIQNYKGLSEA